MRLNDILKRLRTLAPEHLAETWDKVGLHMGPGDIDVTQALLCIDLTEPVMEEAIRQKANLVVAYHPPIFKPLDALDVADTKQRTMMRAVQANMAIYSPHTALDAAAGGVNDWLCEAVLPGVVDAVSQAAHKGATAAGGSIQAIRPIAPSARRRPYKLVTFAPPEHLDMLRQALCEAGAGRIGDYTECSFTVTGEGTFRGGETTRPTVGERGRLERVEERRMEIIVPADRLAAVTAALMKAHPYEEPAFDLIRLALPPSLGGEGVGQGRVVTLDKPITLKAAVERYKKLLRLQWLEVSAPAPVRPIRRVAVCAGAGGSLLAEAGDIDLFVTGEMRHHDMLDAVSRGIALITPGHTQTERPYLPVYRQRIMGAGTKGVDWRISRADRPPSVIR